MLCYLKNNEQTLVLMDERSKTASHFGLLPNNNDFEKKEPSAATINMAVIHCFDLFLPLLSFFFSANPFSGKALKESLSSSRFSIFCGSYPRHNSGNHLIQASIVVVETRSSPHNLFPAHQKSSSNSSVTQSKL